MLANLCDPTKLPSVLLDQNDQVGADFSEGAVRTAITCLQKGKAEGIDKMPNDLYVDFCDVLTPLLKSNNNACRTLRQYPSSFSEGVIATLHKSGDSGDALEYRPITLLTTTYIMVKVISNEYSWDSRD